jgi:hypothetical protein
VNDVCKWPGLRKRKGSFVEHTAEEARLSEPWRKEIGTEP